MKAWALRYADSFVKTARKLDHAVVMRIRDYLTEAVASGDPRSRGKVLVGDFKGYWRYRIGDYRVIAEIRDNELIVIAIEMGHRSDIYR